MGAGLPVLVSDQVYICKEIEEFGAGLICTPETKSVAEALEKLLGKTVSLQAMGECARVLVRARYRPEAASAALVALYRQIVEV
jgi:glycosyltransferase involved in cell wall biosynthesis